jgi:small subunit ribosomal protein S19e
MFYFRETSGKLNVYKLLAFPRVMAYALDVNPEKLIEKAAFQLKAEKKIVPPQWAGYVKTGVHAERPPIDSNWWYMRTAAILRSVYKLGPIGTSKLRTKYGGRKNRGNKPEHFYKGGGAIIRTALQQLEEAGLVKQASAGVHKGRVMTPKGKAFLDNLSTSLVPKREKRRTPEVREEKKADKQVETTDEVKTDEKAKEQATKEQATPKVTIEPTLEPTSAPKPKPTTQAAA